MNSTAFASYGLTTLPLSMKTEDFTKMSRSPRSPSELAQQVLVQFPTSNCTWSPFRTLGGSFVSFSDAMVGLSSRLTFDDTVTFPSTAYTLPNGHFIANVDGCQPYNGFECDPSCAGEVYDTNNYTYGLRFTREGKNIGQLKKCILPLFKALVGVGRMHFSVNVFQYFSSPLP